MPATIELAMTVPVSHISGSIFPHIRCLCCRPSRDTPQHTCIDGHAPVPADEAHSVSVLVICQMGHYDDHELVGQVPEGPTADKNLT